MMKKTLLLLCGAMLLNLGAIDTYLSPAQGETPRRNEIEYRALIEFKEPSNAVFRMIYLKDVKTGRIQAHAGNGFWSFGHIQGVAPSFNWWKGNEPAENVWKYESDKWSMTGFTRKAILSPGKGGPLTEDFRFMVLKEYPEWIFVKYSVNNPQELGVLSLSFNSGWTDFHAQHDKQQGASRHLFVNGKDFSVLKKDNPKVTEKADKSFGVFAVNSKLLGATANALVINPAEISHATFVLGGWGDEIRATLIRKSREIPSFSFAVGKLTGESGKAKLDEFYKNKLDDKILEVLKSIKWNPDLSLDSSTKLRDSISKSLSATPNAALQKEFTEISDALKTAVGKKDVVSYSKEMKRLSDLNKKTTGDALSDLLK